MVPRFGILSTPGLDKSSGSLALPLAAAAVTDTTDLLFLLFFCWLYYTYFLYIDFKCAQTKVTFRVPFGPVIPVLAVVIGVS